MCFVRQVVGTDGSLKSEVTTASSSLQQTWMIMEYCDRGCVQDAVDRGWLRDKPDCIASHVRQTPCVAVFLHLPIEKVISFLTTNRHLPHSCSAAQHGGGAADCH